MILALLPVKDLWQAKQRLSSLLSPEERRALCFAMLADVLAALQAATRLNDILVFSPDDQVLTIARDLGIVAVRETCAKGQSEAVAAAMPICRARGATTVVTIPVDTPLLTGADVDQLVAFWRQAALPSPSAILVPSRDGTGTNSLVLTPPDALPPLFGADSFARHTREAIRRGVAHRACTLPGIDLDIDSPDDLANFLSEAARSPHRPTRTYDHLVRTGIADRCLARTI